MMDSACGREPGVENRFAARHVKDTQISYNDRTEAGTRDIPSARINTIPKFGARAHAQTHARPYKYMGKSLELLTLMSHRYFPI